MSMSERLRAARKSAGFTQKQVAEYIGVTESAYCGYETGKRQPDATKVRAIAGLLEVTGDYILGLVNDPKGYYGVTVSDSDPQIEEIVSICKNITGQGLEYVRLSAEIIAGNPDYQKKKSLTLESSSMREKGRAVARGGVILEQEHPIDEDAFLRAIAESEPPEKV